MSLPVLEVRRRRRPAVLEATQTALIPLRPLSIGEILDGGFLVVRRNVRLMLGLPLVIAGGTAAYVLAGVGLWVLLGNTAVDWAQIALTVVMGLFGYLLLRMAVVWMTAVLARVTLQTVLGDGFAPAGSRVTLRSSLPLFWPVVGLALLVFLIGSTAQGAVSVAYQLLSVAVLTSGSDTLAAVGSIVLVVLYVAGSSVINGILGLTVPALSTESRHAPPWIGKPAHPTSVPGAIGRALHLVGRANIVRVALVFAGSGLISAGILGIVAIGGLLILLLYASAINTDLFALFTNPWTVFGVITFSLLVAMSALIAYTSAVQTLVYLDLRMRREALDLAMRFDCVPIPQPSAPPPVYAPYGPYGPPGPGGPW